MLVNNRATTKEKTAVIRGRVIPDIKRKWDVILQRLPTAIRNDEFLARLTAYLHDHPELAAQIALGWSDEQILKRAQQIAAARQQDEDREASSRAAELERDLHRELDRATSGRRSTKERGA